MAEKFDPYYTWLGIPPEDQPPDHYALLGVRQFESNPDVISNLTDQRMAHVKTFQAGPHGADSQKLLNEIAAARVCLLNPKKRKAYDAKLRAEIALKTAPEAPPIAEISEPIPTMPLAPAQPLAAPPVAAPQSDSVNDAFAFIAATDRPTAARGDLAVNRVVLSRAKQRARARWLFIAAPILGIAAVMAAIMIRNSHDADDADPVSAPKRATIALAPGGQKPSSPHASRLAGNASPTPQTESASAGGTKESSPVTASATAPPSVPDASPVNQGHLAASDTRAAKEKKPSGITEAQRWADDVAALPAEQQVEAVVKKLRERNPGFGGNETHKIEDGVVTELQFVSDTVSDISPVRALAGVRVLGCAGSAAGMGILSDLSPLQGMKLTNLICYWTRVSDLSPLKGMPLTEMNCGNTPVSDLSPLQGMRLALLHCDHTLVSDLSPLKGMPLRELHCWATRISDLSPLQGMPLATLWCGASQISDLSPLKGMPLMYLYCGGTRVSDLSPLKGMPLKMLSCGYTSASDLSPLKGMPLTELNCGSTPAADLSPLRGMALTELIIDGTKASDLSPLEGVSISRIGFTPKNITKGLDVLRQMKSIKTIGISGNGGDQLPPAEFWKKYDAGEFGKPATAAAVRDQKPVIASPDQKSAPPQLVPATATFDNPSKPLKFPLDEWVDLLPMIDTTANAVRGAWTRDGAKITVAHGNASELSLPVSLDGSYDFEFSFKRTEGDGAIAAILSIDSHPSMIMLDGRQGSASGLMNLDGRAANDAKNPIALRPAPLENGRAYRLFASVRIYSKQHASLDISLDGTTYLPHWEGNPDALSADATWALPDPKHLGLGAQSATNFYNARLRMVSPFEQWAKEVAGQPALAAVKSVEGKLRELNPGFRGTFSHEVQNGVVTSFGLTGGGVSDISPVTALTGLKDFSCTSTQVSDLSPLKGLPLDSLKCYFTRVSDLSLLKGMPLRDLWITDCPVSDLSPLEGMPLVALMCSSTKVTNLSPLKGMPLASLSCHDTGVSDLSPLEGMQLNSLDCGRTKITDLSPIKGMHLRWLYCAETNVSDLTPLKGMSLAGAEIPASNITKGMDILRQMTSLRRISNGPHSLPSADFWKKYDAGEFK